MGKQRKLFKVAGLELKPEAGRSEPRLWVRRLVIWRQPNEPPVRDITLRKGLNIVWSPDAAKKQKKKDGIGHGAGKTLFCTLVRYCLGEDRFAPDGQRERIQDAYKDGFVGAEVMLDGTPWAVIRPLGTRRRHVAIPNGDLDELVAEDGNSTGIEPFIHAVQNAMLTEDIIQMIPGSKPGSAWQAALAAITRDQGCHLEDVLSWRDAKSASDSPVRAMSKEDRLVTLRLLIGAFLPAEQALANEIAEAEVHRAEAEHDKERLDWAFRRLWGSLVDALGLDNARIPPGDMGIAAIATAAKGNLEKARGKKAKGLPGGLTDARKAYDVARDDIEGLVVEVGKVEAALEGARTTVTLVKAEMPGASAELDAAGNPVCPVCHVMIDKAMAEGCKISLEQCDVVAIRRRIETLRNQRADAESSIPQHATDLKATSQKLVQARLRAEKLRDHVRTLEREFDRVSTEVRRAQRHVDDAANLRTLALDRESAFAGQLKLEGGLKILRERAAKFREKHAQTFDRLSTLTDALVKRLLGEQAEGKLMLDGNGLHVTVQLGGDRTSAAIEALKVMTADLAILCLSIEGGTRLPAFLIHDSPRESDLGQSIYNRHFEVAKALEGIGKASLFQYIVTTTSDPPEAMQHEPWRVLKIHGAPAAERLLMADL